MKMTKAQLEKAIFETVENESLAGDLGVRIVANAFVKYAGIEIVPDPEPALPRRPWYVRLGSNGLYVADTAGGPGDGNYLLRAVAPDSGYTYANADDEFRQKCLEALVSAYNAAGERKRIVARKGVKADDEFYVNETRYWSPSFYDALGCYVSQHASDLGLEIVES